jgi:hypothetical protein
MPLIVHDWASRTARVSLTVTLRKYVPGRRLGKVDTPELGVNKLTAPPGCRRVMRRAVGQLPNRRSRAAYARIARRKSTRLKSGHSASQK